jgi:hypothetical protein
MPQTVAEIATALTVAAISAHPEVVAPRAAGTAGDERRLGTEVFNLFREIYQELKAIENLG